MIRQELKDTIKFPMQRWIQTEETRKGLSKLIRKPILILKRIHTAPTVYAQVDTLD